MYSNHFDIIAFDLDSTLVKLEGLDWLAKRKGIEHEVIKLTEQSMNGELPVKQAFEKKLALIAPSYADLLALGQEYCKTLVEDAAGTIAAFHSLGKEVWIVTGNFQPAPQIVAEYLDIPHSRILSNQTYFDSAQNYAGYYKMNPLTKNGGKAHAVRKYMKQNGKRIIFVGDAITDLETKPVVDAFIGFGGVTRRTIVEKQADTYILSSSLSPLLTLLLSPEEKTYLTDHGFANLLQKAEEISQQ